MMRSRPTIFILILFVLAIALSACSAQNMQDIEDILDPENVEPSKVQQEQLAREGYADVYYHYHIQVPELKFKIDLPFGVNIAETDEGASFDAEGIFQDLVTFTMQASGGESGLCEVTCTVNLKYVATGSIELGSKGQCEIPMQFTFVPQGDYLMDTTCPPETENVVDCNALSLLLADPGIYTFTGKNPDVTLQKTDKVTQQAEIKNLVLPKDMVGTCSW